MAVVALAGRRRSGKSTTADLITYIGEEMHIVIRKVSFADPLREMFCAETGVTMRELIDPETKELHREWLIEFATEKRADNPYIFIDLLFNTISPSENIVIDDMRSIEELERVVKAGGKPYKVASSQSARETRGWRYNSNIDDHVLETELDLSGDTFRLLGGGQIFNTSSQSYLQNQLFDIVKLAYPAPVYALLP